MVSLMSIGMIASGIKLTVLNGKILLMTNQLSQSCQMTLHTMVLQVKNSRSGLIAMKRHTKYVAMLINTLHTTTAIGTTLNVRISSGMTATGSQRTVAGW